VLPAELTPPCRRPLLAPGKQHSVGGSDYGRVRVGAFMGLRIASQLAAEASGGGGGGANGDVKPLGANLGSNLLLVPLRRLPPMPGYTCTTASVIPLCKQVPPLLLRTNHSTTKPLPETHRRRLPSQRPPFRVCVAPRAAAAGEPDRGGLPAALRQPLGRRDTRAGRRGEQPRAATASGA
jgi:hypothetical protein